MGISEYGLYVPRDTPFHKLDPRVKVAWFVLVFAASVICQYDGSVAFLIYLSLVGTMLLAKISVRKAIMLIVYSAIFFVVTVLVWAAMYQAEGTVLFRVPIVGINLTDVGLLVGTGKFFLIINPITTVWIILITTKPYDLVQLATKLKLPYKAGYVFLIALKLLPTVYDETKNIIDVQKARGLRIDSGNVFTKLMSFIPVFIPLMVRMLGATWELSTALMVRSFGASKQRTYLFEVTWKRRDTVALILMLVVYLAIIALKVSGFTLAPHFAELGRLLAWAA